MILVVGSTFFMTLTQVLARQAGESLHPFEISFFRNLFGFLPLAPLFLRNGFGILRTRRHGLHALRGVVQSVCMMTYFTALMMIPLTDIMALSFTAPLFATVLAMLLLGERLRLRRVSALLFGFLGMLVVLRPGFVEFNPGSGLILGFAIGFAFVLTMMKALSRTESSVTITAYMGVYLTPLTLIPALFVWTWPTAAELWLLVQVGFFGTIAQLLFTQGLRTAEMSVVLPFDFSRLIWASALGFLFFAEIPSIWTWIGGSMIFAGATYIAIRESRIERAKTRAAAAAAAAPAPEQPSKEQQGRTP